MNELLNVLRMPIGEKHPGNMRKFLRLGNFVISKLEIQEPHVPPRLYHTARIILICVNKKIHWSMKLFVGDGRTSEEF